MVDDADLDFTFFFIFSLIAAMTCLKTCRQTATLSWWNQKTPSSELSHTCAGAGESSQSPQGWDLNLHNVRIFENLCLYTFFPPGIQMNKKDKSEPKTLTITPSEKTHFRVILNTETMEEQCSKIDPVCSIIKPEPRTISFDHHNLKPQPHESSPCDKVYTNSEAELSDLTTGSFASEPCPVNTEVGTKCARKTRWTSSPPSSRDSSSAANGGSTKAGPSTADSRTTDSSSTKRGNAFIRRLQLFQTFQICGSDWERNVHVEVHESWMCGGRMWFEYGLRLHSLCLLCIQEEEVR